MQEWGRGAEMTPQIGRGEEWGRRLPSALREGFPLFSVHGYVEGLHFGGS